MSKTILFHGEEGNDSTWFNSKLKLQGGEYYMTPLIFTHGIEMEVQIVEKKGSLLVGPAMKNIWRRMLQGVNKQLNNLSRQKLPPIVSKKYQGARLVEIQKGEKRLNVVQIDYRLPSGEKLKVDSFGPDPNIGQFIGFWN